MKRTGIYWLASYPKSGNTWVRCLISSIRAGGAVPDLNRLGEAIPSAANRELVETILDIPTSDLTAAELAGLRADAYRQRAFDGDSILKVHDVYDPDLFPADVTAGTVLIVRDPRDVAPSLSHHLNITLDHAITQMASPDFVLTSRLTLATQRIGSWSVHTRSWLEQNAGPLLVLRYEDLLADPVRRTTDLCRFLGWNTAIDVISRAVNACRFESLQAAEESGGFPEKGRYQGRFFRRGCAGGWRDSLTCEQAARILRDHSVMLERLGYRSAGSKSRSRQLVI